MSYTPSWALFSHRFTPAELAEAEAEAEQRRLSREQARLEREEERRRNPEAFRDSDMVMVKLLRGIEELKEQHRAKQQREAFATTGDAIGAAVVELLSDGAKAASECLAELERRGFAKRSVQRVAVPPLVMKTQQVRWGERSITGWVWELGDLAQKTSQSPNTPESPTPDG